MVFGLELLECNHKPDEAFKSLKRARLAAKLNNKTGSYCEICSRWVVIDKVEIE